MKTQGSYVIADKRFAFKHHIIGTDAWAAGRQHSFDLSKIAAGQYLVKLDFIVYGTYRQDGNGADAIDHMQLADILSNIRISNGVDKHLDGSAAVMAQDFKLLTGHNPMYCDDIAASSTGSNVDTEFAFIIPFMYMNPLAARPYDYCYPTTLLQDGQLEIQWNVDAALNGDAVSAVQSATLKIIATTASLDRATIPMEVEVGYGVTSAMDFSLKKGNYQHVWLTGFAKADFFAFTNIRSDADGMEVVPSMPITLLVPLGNFERQFVDDELQEYIDFGTTGDIIDKNIPPQPTTVTLDYFFAPVYQQVARDKISRQLFVENHFNWQVEGTEHSIKYCYRRYQDHTDAGLEARSRVMGFGPGANPASRTNRRKLKGPDLFLRNKLPVRLTQSSARR